MKIKKTRFSIFMFSIFCILLSGNLSSKAQDMAYVETIVETPSTTKISATEYIVMRVNIVTVGKENPLELSEMKFAVNVPGLPTNKINKVKLYATEDSPIFSDNNIEVQPIPESDDVVYSIFFTDKTYTLSTGENYFWYVYEIDISTPCDNTLGASLLELKINDEILNIGEQTSDIDVEYDNISILNTVDEYIVCSTSIDTTIVMNTEGTIRGFMWEKWNSVTEEFESIKDNTVDSITILIEDVVNGDNKYRFTALAPYDNTETSTCIENGEFIIDFIVSNPVTSVKLKIDDEEIANDYVLKLCLEDTKIINSIIEGDVSEYIWEYEQEPDIWLPIDTNDMPTANKENLEFIAYDYLKNKNIRLKAVSEEVCGEIIIISNSFNVIIYDPVTSIKFKVDNEEIGDNDTLRFCVGDIKTINSNVVGDITEYNWEYELTPDNWIPILDMPTSEQQHLEFISNMNYANTNVRLKVFVQESCGEYVVSKSIPVVVYDVNYFSLQPPQKVALCDGKDFFIYVNYDGIEPLSISWYKDGFLLEEFTEMDLEIKSVSLAEQGSYYCQIIAPNCYGELDTIKSESTSLFINPKPEMINRMSQVETSIGRAAVLKVDGVFIANPNENSYQWYRRDHINQINIILEDDFNINGVNSNVLTFVHVDETHFTHNGDYYFCILKGLCGDAVTSAPIYLVPEELSILEHPQDVEMCKAIAPYDVNLYIKAFSATKPDKIRYQWYEGTTALVNDAEFDGVETEELKITVDFSRVFDVFTCKVWYEGSDPNIDFIESNAARIIINEMPVILSESDANIQIKEGDELRLSVVTANLIDETYKWFFDGPNGSVELDVIIPELVIDETTISDAGKYTVMITNACGTVTSSYVVDIEANAIKVLSITDDLINSTLSVTPNPASDFINIRFDVDKSLPYSIELIDLKGSVIHSINGNSEKVNIINLDLSNLSINSGTYFINIKFDGKSFSKPLVIIK